MHSHHHLILLDLFSLFWIAVLRFFYNYCISESKVHISSRRAFAFSLMTTVVVEAILTGLLIEELVSIFISYFFNTILSGLVLERVVPWNPLLIEFLNGRAWYFVDSYANLCFFLLLPWKLIESAILALFKVPFPLEFSLSDSIV